MSTRFEIKVTTHDENTKQSTCTQLNLPGELVAFLTQSTTNNKVAYCRVPMEEGIGQSQESVLRMRAPLLSSTDDTNSDELRHRPGATASADSEDNIMEHLFENNQLQPQQQRLLDRSGLFGQSRGRWGVERRLSTVPSPEEQRRRRRYEDSRFCCSSLMCRCCRRKAYRECGKDWFFYLAYKKTAVLFLLLFLSYAFIIGFFGFIYLSLSIFGSKAEVNPDGSTRTIAFCDMGKLFIEFCCALILAILSSC